MHRSPPRESIGRLLQTNREEAIRRLRWVLRLERRFTPRQQEILAEVCYSRSLAEAGRALNISRETVRKTVSRLEELIERSRVGW